MSKRLKLAAAAGVLATFASFAIAPAAMASGATWERQSSSSSDGFQQSMRGTSWE